MKAAPSSQNTDVTLLLLLLLAGHGNHKEDSPFLGGADAAGKRSDFYDRNLALFEVFFFFFSVVQLNMILTSPLPPTTRRSWTSGPRFHLFSAAWSTTPTSRREPKSTRRRRALTPPAGRPPRSGGTTTFHHYVILFQATGGTGVFSQPPPSSSLDYTDLYEDVLSDLLEQSGHVHSD